MRFIDYVKVVSFLSFLCVAALFGGDPDLSAKRRAAALARKTIGKSTGRPRSKKQRCPCGAMTARRAKARGHKC